LWSVCLSGMGKAWASICHLQTKLPLVCSIVVMALIIYPCVRVELCFYKDLLTLSPSERCPSVVMFLLHIRWSRILSHGGSSRQSLIAKVITTSLKSRQNEQFVSCSITVVFWGGVGVVRVWGFGPDATGSLYGHVNSVMCRWGILHHVSDCQLLKNDCALRSWVANYLCHPLYELLRDSRLCQSKGPLLKIVVT
jgi:hypothetical protein